MYPNLRESYCTRLSFGGDIPLSPAALRELRDLVQSLSPEAALPWHFRDFYVIDGTEYECVASLGSSKAGLQERPYSMFMHLGAVSETDTRSPTFPNVGELLSVFSFDVPVELFCSASFYYPEGVGQSLVTLPLGLEPAATTDSHPVERLLMQEVVLLAEGGSGERLGRIEVGSTGGSYHHKVTFFSSARLDTLVSSLVLRRAIQLSRIGHNLGNRTNKPEMTA